MPARDIVVMGASAGGVDALTRLIATLPRGLPAAVFVVLHISASGASVLPRILERAGSLPAAHASDGEPIVPGRVYVAPPDRHLQLHDGQVRVVHGPRENRHRPAVDALFRTAAEAYGPRVIGVVLSGALNDGTAGLLAIKRRGGLALVQDPKEAAFPGMPGSALANVAVDACLTLDQLGPEIVRLVRQPFEEREAAPLHGGEDSLRYESHSAELDMDALEASSGLPRPRPSAARDAAASSGRSSTAG